MRSEPFEFAAAAAPSPSRLVSAQILVGILRRFLWIWRILSRVCDGGRVCFTGVFNLPRIFFFVCMLFVYTISVRTSAISQETNLPGLSESTS